MSLRHFYFVIPQSKVYDCISAASFSDAKAKAFEEYGPMSELIEWLDEKGRAQRNSLSMGDVAK